MFEPTAVRILRSGRKLAKVSVIYGTKLINGGSRPQDAAFAANVRLHLVSEYGVMPSEANNVTSFTLDKKAA
jgi:hypothetical protein